ncbi:MAG: class I SAM-dependent methyltransferase [Ilumatobacter sp.]|uniref:class I SAM-dependent methyltransferase n=1 Tax=Ilumatobacter sp. TaxID=1967498 RepID=UPI0032988A47
MSRRGQFVPWVTAGRVTERQSNPDDVVRATGWVFNNETGSELTLEQFVATGDQEVATYLTVFGLRDPENDEQTFVEIGSGIGRMTCAFTRDFGKVVACDLDAGFLERCLETVGRFGKPDRLQRLHVADGRSLDLRANSADIAFSYITLQHCDADDALDLSSEAVRVVQPGGKVVLNYRSRSRVDTVILPLSKVMRSLFKVPGIGGFLSRQRVFARLGWQANRLQPDEIIGPLAPLLRDVEVWRNPRSRTSGHEATIREFDGINRHHYWIVATVR